MRGAEGYADSELKIRAHHRIVKKEKPRAWARASERITARGPDEPAGRSGGEPDPAGCARWSPCTRCSGAG